MKKFSIMFAAVAIMALTACNEKPAKNVDGETNQPATEQVDTVKDGQPKEKMEHAKPTADGKDHIVAEFDTKEYQMRLENLADGTYRLSLWKAGKDKSGAPDQKVETKDCVTQGNSFLMKGSDGKAYIITDKAGDRQLTIMTDTEIIYNGSAK